MMSSCPLCHKPFNMEHLPVSLACGHTVCRDCLLRHSGPCPIDRVEIKMDVILAPVNLALLQLLCCEPPPAVSYRPPAVRALPPPEQRAYDSCVQSMMQLARYATRPSDIPGHKVLVKNLSHSLMRKLATLVQCSCTERLSRLRAYRTVRALAERTLAEMILHEQYRNISQAEVGNHLWAAVRSRGCQFLGPTIQEEVLRLIILALHDCSGLSRKVLVSFVVQQLKPKFPTVSKTSIGHVVQLLYRASCFRVTRRDRKSSLMQLKEDLVTYEALRREHDAQVVQIATEACLRLNPEQWSYLLYGDNSRRSQMQSVIDKQMTTYTFHMMANDFKGFLQKTRDEANFASVMDDLFLLANVDMQPDEEIRCSQLSPLLIALTNIVSSFVRSQELIMENSHREAGLASDMNPEMTGAGSVLPWPLPRTRPSRLPLAPQHPPLPPPAQPLPSLLFPPVPRPAPLVGRPLQQAVHPQEPSWSLQHDVQSNCVIQPDTCHEQEFERSDSLLATDSESVTQESEDNRYGPIAPITNSQSRSPNSQFQFPEDYLRADQTGSSTRHMTEPPPSEPEHNEGGYLFGHISPLSLAQMELARMQITSLEPAQGAQRELHQTQQLRVQRINQQGLYPHYWLQAPPPIIDAEHTHPAGFYRQPEPQHNYNNGYFH